MKKSISAVLLSGILTISLSACGGNLNSKVDELYRDFEGYTAKVEVKLSGSGKQEEFKAIHQWQPPHNYRSEITEPDSIKGTQTIIKGTDIWLKDADGALVKIEYGVSGANIDYVFVSDFFDSYYSQAEIQPLSEDEDNTIVLNTSIHGESSRRFTQSLWLDRKTLKPVRLSTFDIKGNEVICVNFLEFEFSNDFEDIT